MKTAPALLGTAAASGVSITAFGTTLKATPWTLLVLIVTLFAALGLLHRYLTGPQGPWDRLLELIRTLQRR